MPRSLPDDLMDLLSAVRSGKIIELHDDREVAYSTKELKTIIQQLNNRMISASPRTITRPLNAILQMLLGESLLLPSKIQRNLTLGDLKYQAPEGNRPPLLIFRFKESSTGDYRHVACARHKSPLLCLVGALALNFWFRFDFPGGPLAGVLRPSFLNPGSFSKVKLQYSNSSNQMNNISADYQHELIGDALESIGKGIKRRNRPANSDNFHIKQLEWTSDASLENLSLRFIKLMAGFEGSETYLIQREQIIPPESLQRKIFPWLEAEVVLFNQQGVDSRDSFGSTFFSIMLQFRIIVLQDLAHISQLAPKSILSRHSINQDPEFLQFKKKFNSINRIEKLAKNNAGSAVREVEHGPPSRDTNLLILLYASDTLKIAQKLREGVKTLNSELDCFSAQSEGLKSQLDKLAQNVENLACVNRVAFTEIKRLMYETHLNTLASEANPHAINMLSLEVQQFAPPPHQVPVLPHFQSSGANEAQHQELYYTRREESRKKTASVPFQFRGINGFISTVPQLIQNWYYSVGDNLSVIEKEKRFGNKWRLDEGTRQKFFKRKRVIRFIHKLRRLHSFSLNQAGTLLECYRRECDLTIPQLQLFCNPSESELMEEVVKLAKDLNRDERLQKYGLNFNVSCP